jgi:diadenosine tetraphosphate (Ap4A) HIT family hydrolase
MVDGTPLGGGSRVRPINFPSDPTQPLGAGGDACVFCQAIAGYKPVASVDYNACLTSSERFVVLPALGPLRRGHVLVVSRVHAPSLASTGRDAIAEYAELVETVAQGRQTLGGEFLEAEHGATSTAAAGGCIVHAHVNLIPGASELHDVLVDSLPSLDVSPPITNLASVNKPYIMLKNRTHLSVYDATNAPSQLIRRYVCKSLGREDEWDWALFPRLELIAETIREWKDTESAG